MLKNTDGLLSEGEWDSPSEISPHALKTVVNGGEKVRVGGIQCLGAGAEPLSNHQLSTGHYDYDLPSRISVNRTEMLKEEIESDIAGDARQMMKEESRQITDVEG